MWNIGVFVCQKWPAQMISCLMRASTTIQSWSPKQQHDKFTGSLCSEQKAYSNVAPVFLHWQEKRNVALRFQRVPYQPSVSVVFIRDAIMQSAYSAGCDFFCGLSNKENLKTELF